MNLDIPPMLTVCPRDGSDSYAVPNGSATVTTRYGSLRQSANKATSPNLVNQNMTLDRGQGNGTIRNLPANERETSPQKSALNELSIPISGLISSRFQVAGGGPLPAIILIMRLPTARSKLMRRNPRGRNIFQPHMGTFVLSLEYSIAGSKRSHPWARYPNSEGVHPEMPADIDIPTH